MSIRYLMAPIRRIFSVLFLHMMQAEIAEANLGLANSRIPPTWCIERDKVYPLRFYRTDLEVWAASTDLEVARQGPAASMRITGAARAIVREIPVATLQNGAMVNINGNPVQLSGLGMLLRILERRYGATEEETQIHAISELMQFSRQPGETTDMCMARFDIAMHRANNFGGVIFAPQLKAWLLLSHLRIPRSGWMVLLSATNGLLPANDDEYTDFTLYIRRNGHLHDTGYGDAQKTIAQPYFAQKVDTGNQTYFGQSWSGEQYGQSWNPTYAEFSSGGQQNVQDDNISWHSFSTGRSDEDEPIDWTGVDAVAPAYRGEHIYLGYRNHKRMWRKFGGKPRPRFKGVIKDKTKSRNRFGKGAQSGKGGGLARTFWVDDFGHPIPINNPPSYPAVAEPETPVEVYFKGKGKGNPIGKDGKQMLCSICDSNMHFRAKCTKGAGKGGNKGGKVTFWANHEYQYLGPDNPNSSSSQSEQTNPNAASIYFSASNQQERSRIYFADGSEEALTPHRLGVGEADSSEQVLQTVDDHLRKYFHPPVYAWMNACYHTNVRLAKGEAMLVDCGAVGDLSGDKQIFRMAELARQHGHGTAYTPLRSIMNVDGVGKGSTECKQSAVVPVVTADGRLSTYTAPMITDSEIPSLLGLNTMTKQRVLLDLVHDKYIMVGAGGFELKLSPGSTVLDLKRAPTGHIMLPCSHWDKVIPGAKQHAFVAEATGEPPSSQQ